MRNVANDVGRRSVVSCWSSGRGKSPGTGCATLGLLLLLASACGDEANAPDPYAVAPVCTSGVLLDPNYQPAPEMAPGRACIPCHLDENSASGEEDAPVFSFSGTAYPTAHEPDYCAGAAASGAVVEVTDARGMTFTTTVNPGGNFYAELAGFTYPYRAKLTFEGRTREMIDEQTTGDCNSCHTQDGADPDAPRSPAPGRILLP
ncbi:MAG TPA: hypothetical protein VGP07_06930 [Polyangia bacterium]|jgi:hypothetical protein